ncbi:MAG: DNA primase [Clostridia bacterium]|nr:DNA primase [Clostridia bacterium]
MRFTDEFLNELRSKNDIESVISQYVNLKRAGRLSKGLCPFHNEKSPSFTVYPDNQSFYCFGCGAGGEVITFIRRIENLDYIEAVKVLAERAGMNLPEDGYDDTLAKHRQRILAANREAARFFHSYMMSEQGRTGLEYFLGRGLTMQTIKHFGLGYAPDSWDALLKHMRSKGFTNQELFDANLVRESTKYEKKRYYDNFRNRAMVPIIDLRGNVIAFGGRVLDDSKPKYINTSDTLVYKKSNGVFALNFAKNGNPSKLIVCEGYMDVIAMHQAGFTNSVACLGTALTQEQARLVSRYADEIILSYDSDEAGQKATKRAIDIFGTTGVKIRVLKLTGGKDPDEIIRKYGKEKFQGLIDGAANDIEYGILRERDKYYLDSIDGRTKFLTAVADILANSNPIVQDAYASKLAAEMQISKDAILQQIKTAYRHKAKAAEKEKFSTIVRDTFSAKDEINPDKPKHLRAAKAEETLIATIMLNPDFYPKIKEKITPDIFVTEFNCRVYEAVAKRLDEGRSIELSVFSSEFSPMEMGRIAQLTTMGNKISCTVAECDDCIKILKQEKSKITAVNPADLDGDEFRNLFRNLNNGSSTKE